MVFIDWFLNIDSLAILLDLFDNIVFLFIYLLFSFFIE